MRVSRQLLFFTLIVSQCSYRTKRALLYIHPSKSLRLQIASLSTEQAGTLIRASAQDKQI